MSHSLPLGELLRKYRTEAHLSQEELAERAGVAARTIGDLETGVSLSPRAITVSLICEALALDEQSREVLRSASRRRGLAVSKSLPEGVPLIGRDAELQECLTLLRDDAVRLVTLAGGPGIGKTALAAAAAKELGSDYGERLRFIDFGGLPDAALVPTKVSLAFGIRDVWGDSVTGPIAAALGSQPMLMIADNFERVAAAAPFISELLIALPQLKVLVASRRRLRLTAERALSVGWLSPESSLALLVRRVRELSPEFDLPHDDEGLMSLARVLGGLPLAIELAAPLLRSASPAELASRLAHGLDVLGSRDLHKRARRHTMRDAINSSYVLLEVEEQRLFRRLAVFGGRFTEDAAQHIAGDCETSGERLRTLRALATLLDHSLIGASAGFPDDVELEIHPLVSEFARELLEREGEKDAAYLCLTNYCFSLANTVQGPEPLHDAGTRRRLSRESAHFDIALGWLKSSGRLRMAFSLALAAGPNWVRRAEGAHGYAWISSLLADPGSRSLDEALLGEIHWVASSLAKASEQIDRADEHIAIALPLKRAAGDRKAVASLLDGLGVGAFLRGDYAKARTFCEEGLAIRRELGEGLLTARSLLDLGACAADEGEFAAATRYLEEALQLFREAGRRTGVAAALGNLALVALRAGLPSRSELLARESVELAESVGFAEAAKQSKITLSRALLALGDLEQAETLARRVASEESLPILLGEVARALSALAFVRGELRLASRLLGAASLDPMVVPFAERESHAKLAESLRAALGGDFEAQYELGRNQGIEALRCTSIP